MDYDIPVTAATVAAEYGVYGFILVSSIGADANNNSNFYLKLKGVVEEAVSGCNFPRYIYSGHPYYWVIEMKRDWARIGPVVGSCVFLIYGGKVEKIQTHQCLGSGVGHAGSCQIRWQRNIHSRV